MSPSQGSPVPLSLTGSLQRLFSHVKIENLIAGLSGGVMSTLVLHPLDLVKIRFAGMCVQPEPMSLHVLGDYII